MLYLGAPVAQLAEQTTHKLSSDAEAIVGVRPTAIYCMSLPDSSPHHYNKG